MDRCTFNLIYLAKIEDAVRADDIGPLGVNFIALLRLARDCEMLSDNFIKALTKEISIVASRYKIEQ